MGSGLEPSARWVQELNSWGLCMENPPFLGEAGAAAAGGNARLKARLKRCMEVTFQCMSQPGMCFC